MSETGSKRINSPGPDAGQSTFDSNTDSLVIIVIMGSSGSGKITFVSHCVDDFEFVRHDWTDDTAPPAYHCALFPGAHVELVVGPNMDRTTETTFQSFVKAMNYIIARRHEKGVKRWGMIWLEQRHIRRLDRATRGALSQLEEGYGRAVLRHIILAAWDGLDEGYEVMYKGLRIEHHTNDRASAVRLLSKLVHLDPDSSEVAMSTSQHANDAGQTPVDLPTSVGQEDLEVGPIRGMRLPQYGVDSAVPAKGKAPDPPSPTNAVMTDRVPGSALPGSLQGLSLQEDDILIEDASQISVGGTERSQSPQKERDEREVMGSEDEESINPVIEKKKESQLDFFYNFYRARILETAWNEA